MRVGQVITCPLGFSFAWVPPGQSWLGGGGGEPGEKSFTLEKGLWCGVYPVTQGQWQQVMGNNPSHFKDNPNHPVEQVSWNDVQKFLKKVNQQKTGSGYLYRLPTHKEWGYICRAGPIPKEESAYDFYFATSKTDLTPVRSNVLSSHQANFDGNHPAGNAKKGPYLKRTSPVGSYLPNPQGIHDLHGNVWEWTSTPTGSGRLYCGGGWDDLGQSCSAAYRRWSDLDFRDFDLGFRLLAVSGEG